MVNENIIFDKNRKLPNMGEGNRFLIMRRKVRKAGDEESMQKVTPIMAGRLIRGVGSVIDMKLIRDGGLLIRAKNYKAANSIYQIVKIPGFEVEVAEYTQLNKSVGVIFDRSLVAATDDEILTTRAAEVHESQENPEDSTRRLKARHRNVLPYIWHCQASSFHHNRVQQHPADAIRTESNQVFQMPAFRPRQRFVQVHRKNLRQLRKRRPREGR